MRRLSGMQCALIKHHLKAGGIIAYPTESCYGLGCLPLHTPALRRIIKLKNRCTNKGLIIIATRFSQLSRLLARLPEKEVSALNHLWQESCTTFLLPAHANVPPLLRGIGHRKIGVRIPKHTAARNLCRVLNTALVSTSANRAHQRPCKTYREARRQFGADALVLKGRIGKRTRASTIVDWASGTILR